MTGRPTDYSDDLAARICAEIASGRSLRSICAGDDFPASSTVFKWLTRHTSFAEQYTRAREAQADAMAEDILDISDDGSNDWMVSNADDNAGYRLNGEHIQRSRLRVDSRKWLMSKMAPKKYADRLDLNHSGSIERISDAELDARLAKLLGKAGVGGTAGGAAETEGSEPAR